MKNSHDFYDHFFKLMKEKLDSEKNKGIFEESHCALNDEDKFVEDFLYVGCFIVKSSKLKNIIRLECQFKDFSWFILLAVDDKEHKTVLSFNDYIGRDTPFEKNYLDEAMAIAGDKRIDTKSVCEKIKTQSGQFLKDNL